MWCLVAWVWVNLCSVFCLSLTLLCLTMSFKNATRWETFTEAVVKVLSTRKNIVYLLWGNPAQLKYVFLTFSRILCCSLTPGMVSKVFWYLPLCILHRCSYLCRCQGIDEKNNKMITTSHPSPLGAYKTSSPFMGSRYGPGLFASIIFSMLILKWCY